MSESLCVWERGECEWNEREGVSEALDDYTVGLMHDSEKRLIIIIFFVSKRRNASLFFRGTWLGTSMAAAACARQQWAHAELGTSMAAPACRGHMRRGAVTGRCSGPGPPSGPWPPAWP